MNRKQREANRVTAAWLSQIGFNRRVFANLRIYPDAFRRKPPKYSGQKLIVIDEVHYPVSEWGAKSFAQICADFKVQLAKVQDNAPT